ncbi:MAG: hypothetical protein JWP27_651 [Flaviaesturariibacter sp.]|nr:hypothetical protein [Flaviaesturariibacter sp.]
MSDMEPTNDPRGGTAKPVADNENQPRNDREEKQTDPNLTELKGFVDPDEKIEPEGTDNPDVKGLP